MCLTKNRRQWLPRAIACFQAQTYQDRELLIVADGADVQDLVPDDPQIRLIHVRDTPMRIGDKRNFACGRAAGELVAHWDDDDYSAPGRLADQVGRLLESGRAVTGYRQMPFTDGEKWWMYQGAPQYAVGTSLCYRKSWWEAHPFRSLQICEDLHFVDDAAIAKQLISVEDKGLMYATIHKQNTSPRNLASNWTPMPNFEWRDAA